MAALSHLAAPDGFGVHKTTFSFWGNFFDNDFGFRWFVCYRSVLAAPNLVTSLGRKQPNRRKKHENT